ncbi:uncharacterized protein LOC114371726 [Glycine soja]|uniref:uncharacterized protein n=1 Tax=Glycine max TaxID=3847 RepID=UPI000E21BEB7|nr:uncharacterized protein LOC112998192 [Glycine max]XP_028184879.1 uncharacterized protein LOC114371726 [Glycine soja]|eukprot:XP_025980033.1 uncharacterized protein LOC112998192 [Glycine max]
MNRSWIQAPCISDEYEKGVEDFLQFAQQHAPVFGGNYLCPCVNCVNGRHQSLDDIRSHLICDGFSLSYTNWIWHDELPDMSTTANTESQHVQIKDRMEDMIRDLGQKGFLHAHAPYYEELQIDSKLPLYLGCTTYTRLSVVLALENLKAIFGWSDKSLTELLVLLKNMLPNENTLPKSHYDAKKILCPVGMEYQKIHACRNDCILYGNEFAEMRNCPTCGVSRYKVNDGENNYDVGTNNNHPIKVCWYLLVIPRFKRLLASADESSNHKWHAFGRINDGLL